MMVFTAAMANSLDINKNDIYSWNMYACLKHCFKCICNMMLLRSECCVNFRRRIKKHSLLLQFLSVPILFCCAYLYYGIGRYLFHDYLRDKSYLEVEKCPACYGQSLCPVFNAGRLSFDSYSRIRLIDHFNVKNTNLGKFDNNTKVMLKKLAYNSEFTNFDDNICKLAKGKPGCDVVVAFYKTKYATTRELSVNLLKNMTDMVFCPSQRLLDLILEKYREKGNKSDKDLLSIEERLQLMTTLMLNPEPIMMQTFPREEGWPFPHYYGACGRMVVVERVERSLYSAYHDTWEERIDYAYQLLTIARKFTDNDHGFSLYWTDVGYDNLAIDGDGKVIVIDLEDIIVVDKAKLHRKKKKVPTATLR